jgi:hypothetical protein
LIDVRFWPITAARWGCFRLHNRSKDLSSKGFAQQCG